MKEILRNQEKMYVLFEDDGGGYVLNAMCGGVGMYEVKVRLNSDESARFNVEGEDYIESLAFDIGKQTSKYRDRMIP